MARAAAKRVGRSARTQPLPPPKLKIADERHYADLGSVQEFAEGLKESFLHCRELGHNWKPWGAGRHPDGGWERSLRCTRCKTERHQTITPTGMVMSNKYVHPEGYLSEGLGRIVGEGRGLLRIEAIKRHVGNEE